MVDGAQKLVDLLIEVFDGEHLRTYYRDNEVILHTEVRIDDSIIMIADSTSNWPAMKIMLHVYVPNVDDTFTKAISYGCKVLEEPVMRAQDHDKRGMFEDFAGNIWAVGTQNL